MRSWARCPWGGIILILAWGIGRMEDPLPDGASQGHWRGLQSRSAPGPCHGEWSLKSREEAAMGVISSLRNHSLVFLEHPVGCSVSPASLRGRDHAGEHSWRTGRRPWVPTGPSDTPHVSLSRAAGASTPGAPLKGGCRTRCETRTHASVHTHEDPLYCKCHCLDTQMRGLLR